MIIKRQNTCGVILAGGAGQRVKGRNKGLINYFGEPLIEHVIRRLQPQVRALIISANRDLERYRKLHHAVIIDDTNPSFQGPVAGISAVLESLIKQQHFEAILVSSCDTPDIPQDLFSRLSLGLNKGGLVAVANDGHRTQNLHCLIKREAWASLIDFYNEGGRAMHRWHKKNDLIKVDFSDQANAFLNLNSEQTFREAE